MAGVAVPKLDKFRQIMLEDASTISIIGCVNSSLFMLPVKCVPWYTFTELSLAVPVGNSYKTSPVGGSLLLQIYQSSCIS